MYNKREREEQVDENHAVTSAAIIRSPSLLLLWNVIKLTLVYFKK